MSLSKKSPGLSLGNPELCRNLWDGHPSAIIVVDANGTITLTNSKLEQLFGYSSSEVIGKPIEILIPRRYGNHQKLRSDYAKCPHKRESLSVYGLKGLTKSGDEVHVDVALNPMTSGDRQYVIAYLRDMTEQISIEEENRALQEQLLRSQKVAALGELTGGMAHDFNNVLSAILGNTDLALIHNANSPSSDEELEKCLSQINSAACHARDLISNLLAFSRKESIKNEPIALGPLVEEVMSMLRAILPSSIRVHVTIDDVLPKVNLNPISMQQIITNLCINARDAMEGTGELAVNLSLEKKAATQCSSCGKRVPGNYVVFRVKDSGKGIDREIMRRIFEPMFTTKEIGKGTGMGLSVVHRIVHQCDGHLQINSIPGEGSEFHVLFPPVQEDINGEE